MPNFAKKIELDDTLTELFLSFLLDTKYQVPTLSTEQQNLISYISGRFLISGFILRSCDFNSSHKSLVEQLKYQRRMHLLKQISMKHDLDNIAKTLNERGIGHAFLKGTALNADGIYSSGMRVSRDIDLLVGLNMLDEAYSILKSLGFKYLNKKTRDSVKYHHFGHHFPPMINENGTKLELHWRVTHTSDFKYCPLAEIVLANRRTSNANPHIFSPKIEITIAHLIHHSFIHHRMSLGPVFLFDLATIFTFCNKEWPIDKDLHKKLGIYKNFELCKIFIERVREESSFSSESKLLIDQIFKNSEWLRLSDESKAHSVPVKTTRIEIFDKYNLASKLLIKMRNNRTLYQVSYYSAKFWLILASDICVFLGKVLGLKAK